MGNIAARVQEIEWLLNKSVGAISRLPRDLRITYCVTVAAIQLQLNEMHNLDPVQVVRKRKSTSAQSGKNVVSLK